MKVSEIISGQISLGRRNNRRDTNCCPKPKYVDRTYSELIIENAIKDIALKEASRIIAQDIYMKSNK